MITLYYISYIVDDVIYYSGWLQFISSFHDLCWPARIIVDRETGRSRGFGFVNFVDNDSASSALSAMDGQVRKKSWYVEHVSGELGIDYFILKFQELNGRNIRVSYANERPGGPRSFGGNGGAGDFRGDRGFGGGFGGNSEY